MATQDDDIEVDVNGDAWLTIGGVRAKLVTEDEAQQVDYVICGNHSYFPDDVHTTCARCTAPIVHRPTAPSRPPKLCLACATQEAKCHRP